MISLLFDAIIIPPVQNQICFHKISSLLSIFVIAPPAAFKIASGEAKSQSFGELLPGKLKHI